MQYIVTWTEGEEVCYRFVSEEEIKDLIETIRIHHCRAVN